MCGLSSNQPFCDGSHKKTADEEDNKTYAYEKEGNEIEVKNWKCVLSGKSETRKKRQHFRNNRGIVWHRKCHGYAYRGYVQSK